MIATLRHEFGMQIRRPALWIVYGLAFVLLVISFRQGYLIPDIGRTPRSVTTDLLAVVGTVNVLMPMAYGCLLADRLVRDGRLGVSEVLDAAPASRTGRLIGKYLGACAATAVPIALVYFGRVAVYAVTEGGPGALPLSVLVFAATALPGLLFVGALALAGPLLVPVPLFRVLFVGYWFWGSLIPADMMPTLSHTVLSPGAHYAEFGLLYTAPSDPYVRPYGPWPDAVLNVLRPVASPGAAFLWMGVMAVLTVAVLLLVRLHTSRTA
ncbi:ABC transporter permease [Streptosporangium saharense]|uniref:ABC transporter permease n=1 Tax=Streptosporangium saharense TaxID=1706840 RepID=UPI0036B12674